MVGELARADERAPVDWLALASWMGDPTDPSSWSGTPYNLTSALRALGVEVVPCATNLPRWVLAPALLASLGSGRWFEPLRSSVVRTAYQMVLATRLRDLPAAAVLHMGELDLPFRPDGRRHFLYVDSTLDLYLRRPGAGWRSLAPGRKDAEKATARGFAQVERFFPMAQYVADNLIQRYGIPASKVTVVGTGRGKIKPVTGAKDFSGGHVLFVAKGRVREKGGYLLVEAFRRLRARGCDVPLVIVGATELAEALRGLSHVEVHGYIAWEKLEELFHRAILFAMPALHEPWGLVYLEALATRTPVLGLRRNSLPEITANGAYGFLADDDSPEAVADALFQALSDRARLKSMGEAGQAYCLANFSWDKTAARIIEGMAR